MSDAVSEDILFCLRLGICVKTCLKKYVGPMIAALHSAENGPSGQTPFLSPHMILWS